jgi:hypothetical protein
VPHHTMRNFDAREFIAKLNNQGIIVHLSLAGRVAVAGNEPSPEIHAMITANKSAILDALNNKPVVTETFPPAVPLPIPVPQRGQTEFAIQPRIFNRVATPDSPCALCIHPKSGKCYHRYGPLQPPFRCWHYRRGDNGIA